jgi:pimeloyl-ACP methyl ester carboxylesterase
MLRLRRLLPILASLASLALRAAGQGPVETPTDIKVRHRSGQTFLIWRELPEPDVRYRVYHSSSAILSEADLAKADLLGEVDDRSSRNQGRSLASGTEQTWVVIPGGVQLLAEQGLFVYTAETRVNTAFYAVTSVQAGVENKTIVPDVNATQLSVKEIPAAPQPVLQADDGPDGQLWAHWVGNRDTPFQPALSPWASRGFNFLFQPGTAVGPHGLVLCLHAAGQTQSQAWPQRFELPQDVDRLALSDLAPYTSWTFWFGSQELMPGQPDSTTHVWNYTQQRIAWTLDWITAQLGAAHDPERVYVVGGSMGAIGGMYLLSEYPERFAAALLRNGLYDLRATDYRNRALFERMFGSFTLDLLTRTGLPILERTNASFMAARDPSQDWPVVRTINGRSDETVGWMSAVGLYAGLAAAGRPAVHYFDERTHEPDGYWRGVERRLLTRTLQTRRDRPSLRFGNCTLDDDPGDGARTSGDLIGTINGYVDYDPHTAHADETALDFDVYVRNEGALDDAPRPRALATLEPWRTGAFRPVSGEAVHYTLRHGNALVDEHLLFADEFGHVRTPPTPLDTSRRAARFERGTPETSAPFFLGSAPYAGGEVQMVLRGTPGAPWSAFLWLGDGAGPIAPQRGTFFRSGAFGPNGVAELVLPLPNFIPAHALLSARARIAGLLTPTTTLRVQDGTGWGPDDVQPR